MEQGELIYKSTLSSADIQVITEYAHCVFSPRFTNVVMAHEDAIVLEAHGWGFQKFVYGFLCKAVGIDYQYM